MTRGNIAWEVTSERQVISHAPSVKSMVLMQERHTVHLLYNKTVVDLCFGGHGVLLNSKLKHTATVNMTLTVQ